MKPYQLSLKEAIEAIKKGELTPLTLTESLLERIDKIEPKIHAWVTINRDQLLKEVNHESKTGSTELLNGIPVGVKDIYSTKNLRTTMGSPIYRDFIPNDDAEIVSILKKKGAIILGKTETTEFALHDPAPTTNPWNITHTPGGSSSGSAAAVSTGMCPLAFGSQTGGSIIRPASYCGVVGLKPTYDLLSRKGVYPLSWSLDHIGFMTRNVEDAYFMVGILLGEVKSWKVWNKLPRIGVLRGYFKEKATPLIWEGYEKAITKLWGEGADMIDVELPESFKHVQDAHRVIMSVETASVHEDLFKEKRPEYGEYIQGYISSGLLVPATTYLRAQRVREIIINDIINLIGDYDCLICPSTTDTAPKGLSWTGSPAFNIPWSLTGLPSITVPTGLARDKLPIGLQIIVGPFKEWDLLRIAGWCEEKFEFQHRPIDPVEPVK